MLQVLSPYIVHAAMETNSERTLKILAISEAQFKGASPYRYGGNPYPLRDPHYECLMNAGSYRRKLVMIKNAFR
jgi:hypothetical protein